MRKHLLIIALLLTAFQLNSQVLGRVTDQDGKPLSTVNIYIENSFKGTTSNDEGRYELELNKTGSYTFIFRYLGYKTEKRSIEITSFPYKLDVQMTEEKLALDEVVISTTENPADRIIRNAISKRKEMLEKIDTYKAKFYSRGLIRIKDAPETIMGQDIGDLGGGLDSTRSGIIYLSETISDIKYRAPNDLSETIQASKISGDDNGFSFNTASDINFVFYRNTIELGNQIISPIADFAFNYYRYKLDGAFYDDKGHLVNKIQVIPKRPNDPIFKGFIYIVEDQWTIYALELDITGEQARIPPAEVITLKQNFSFSQQDDLWVLISQTLDFSYGFFGIKGDGRFTAVYSDYDFDIEFEDRNFGREIVRFEDEANKKDSLYWKIERPVPLTSEERNDYIKKDSIQEIRESKEYLDSVDAVNNRFKLGDLIGGYNYSNTYEDTYFNINSPLFATQFNTVQGFHSKVNIGYRKNFDEFRKYLRIGGAIDYGFSDNRLRATGSITYQFNNISRPVLTLSGGVAATQVNAAEPISPLINSVSSLLFEDNYMKLYDRSYISLRYGQEWFNGLRFNGSVNYERRKALANTTDQVWINQDDDLYTSNHPTQPASDGRELFETHNILKVFAGFDIRFGRKYYSYPGSKFNYDPPQYPKLFVGYEGGFGASQTGFNYSQLKARFWQNFNISNKGEFGYNILAGSFLGADDIAFVDYQHFRGNQTHIGTSGSYLDVFNNLPYYGLSTNGSYLEAHVEHDFKGFILGKIPGLNALGFNLVLGGHALGTEGNKPYFEYTAGLDNIGWGKFRLLRVDYIRSYQNGFRGDAVIFGLKFLNFFN